MTEELFQSLLALQGPELDSQLAPIWKVDIEDLSIDVLVRMRDLRPGDTFRLGDRQYKANSWPFRILPDGRPVGITELRLGGFTWSIHVDPL